jgi:hypothetical protein
MCTQIVVEKEFVVKAVREFKRIYPQTANAHRIAVTWGGKFLRQGYVHDNENGSWTIKIDAGKGKVEFLVVNKVCTCGISNPCAHRIAINLAKMALDIRAAASKLALEHAEVQSELAEPSADWSGAVAALKRAEAEYRAAETRTQYRADDPEPRVIVENPNDFHVESEEVRAVLREQEERDNE